MNVELDEMKNAWLLLDRRLERQEALNLHAFREGRLDRLRKSLQPLQAGQIVQLVIGGLMALLFAPFWVEHLDTPHLVAVGVSLHVYALMFIVLGARDLYLIRRIDYSAPVVDIQRRLAGLRAWRIRVAPIFGAVGCLIWVPFMLWLFEVLFGVDVYASNPGVVYVLIASGLGCLGLFLLFLHWARQPRRERIAKYLEDSAAGRSIARAQRFLDEVTAFAREA
jgi:hypothetical protein